jgi:hypothetical protein
MLHILVDWPLPTLRGGPSDVLVRVFNVASFAMNAVLGINLEALSSPILNPLINPGWAIAV